MATAPFACLLFLGLASADTEVPLLVEPGGWRALLVEPKVLDRLALDRPAKERVGLLLAAAEDRESALTKTGATPQEPFAAAEVQDELAKVLTARQLDYLAGWEIALRGSVAAYFQPLRKRLEVSEAQFQGFERALKQLLGNNSRGEALTWPLHSELDLGAGVLERLALEQLTSSQRSSLRLLERALPPGVQSRPSTAAELLSLEDALRVYGNPWRSDYTLLHYLRAPTFRARAAVSADVVAPAEEFAAEEARSARRTFAQGVSLSPANVERFAAMRSREVGGQANYRRRTKRLAALVEAKQRVRCLDTWAALAGIGSIAATAPSELAFGDDHSTQMVQSMSFENLQLRGELTEEGIPHPDAWRRTVMKHLTPPQQAWWQRVEKIEVAKQDRAAIAAEVRTSVECRWGASVVTGPTSKGPAK